MSVAELLSTVLSWSWRIVQFIVSPTGILIDLCGAALSGFAVFFYDAFTGSIGALSPIVEFLHESTPVVQNYISFLDTSPWWSFFVQLFALDVLGQSLSWFVGLATATLIMMAFGFVFASITAVLPFFILKSVRSIVSICTGGIFKP